MHEYNQETQEQSQHFTSPINYSKYPLLPKPHIKEESSRREQQLLGLFLLG